MSWPQAFIVYFVCWWLLLFMALPIGVKPQDELAHGSDAGAPHKTYLVIKCAGVTVIAAFATWAIDFVIRSGIVAVK